MKILITGGAGFIGSATIRHIINYTEHSLLNIDKLTYAGNLESLNSVSSSERYLFKKIDICDAIELEKIFVLYQPDAIMHLAAESHVDRSIDNAADFIQTNIVGTFQLLNISKKYWSTLSEERKTNFRFHHISTDEVFGDLAHSDNLFTEQSNYKPNSPYAASKASSDHLARAWHRTYGFPVIITNCSNNYGPYHFPEKLIPLMILNSLEGRPLPVYGDGQQIRDWLYVEDHARALLLVLEKGTPGETYNIGGYNELANIDVVNLICELMEELKPNKPLGIKKYTDLITHVTDRPGHDIRYAIDATKITQELGWSPTETFETGLRKTIIWFLENKTWWSRILDGSYNRERLGNKG